MPQPLERTVKAEKADRRQTEASMQELKSSFTTAGIKFKFSAEVISLEEILKHSVYADLIIADALLQVAGPFRPSPNMPVRDLLADAHCPVLLLRGEDMPPDRLVLLYDGSYSAMKAIRSFSYLFPNLRDIPCSVVYAAGKGQDGPADLDYLRDWLPLHFDKTTVEILSGEPADVLPAFSNRNSGSTLVVMGAYGRSELSRLFRRSLANSILAKANASLFVTHER